MQFSRSHLALVGLALVYATLLANAVVGYVNLRTLYDNDRWVIHTYEVIHAINRVFFILTNVETAQRGYVSTGEISYLQQYENSVSQVNNAVEQLTALMIDNPRRAQDIAELKQQVTRKLDAIRGLVETRRDSGFAAAQTLALTGESRRALETLRETVTRMAFDEQRLLVDRQTQSEASFWRAVISGAVAGALGICLSLIASVLVWRDFTTRNEAAAYLRTANERLAQQAEQLTRINHSLETEIAERKRVEEALHEADERKDQFLATLAHELRNPLSPLLTAAQLLALEPGNSSDTKEMAAVMLRQVEQLTRLIDDLLDVSRISRGKLQLQVESVALGDALSAALDVGRSLIESKHHELSVSLPQHPVIVQADKVRLAQIIGNLLINAAKYTPARGKISLDVQVADECVQIHVRDDGIGIAPEVLPRIFGLFTQADATTQRSHGGLGIGLSLAKTLVEMHGGSLKAASGGLGQGSEFVVTLPFAPQPTGQVARIDQERSAASAPAMRILVVDDNQSASHLLSRLLTKLGQAVRVVHSAAAALTLVAEWRPQVVISDIAMPEVSGYELARRIRELPGGAEMILIALTGYGQDADRKAALDAGFDEHLTKPIGIPDLQSLLERIAQQLGSRHDAAQGAALIKPPS